MRLTRLSDLAAFAARAEPFLIAREAEHCVAIGILSTLKRGETYSNQSPYLALVEDDTGQVVAAPLATPPFHLVLSQFARGAADMSDEILRLIAQDVRAALPDLSGVNGPATEAQRFTELWTALTTQQARVMFHERLYRLTEVRPTRPAPGDLRRIESVDKPVLRAWLHAFAAEAMGMPEYPALDADLSRWLRFDSSGMYLWLDGGAPVSLAGYSGPTPHGIRIGPVYTPPAARGRGYAGALVAALSQRLLDDGRQFVFLFTDLANPTANHIYQAIGYEPVGDVTAYSFARAT